MFFKLLTRHSTIYARVLALTLLFSFFLVSCDNDDPQLPPAAESIADIIRANSDFSILAAALEAADGDLIATLNGAGPFTLFAPSDNAFAAAGITDLSAFTGAELQTLLTYHVLSGAFASSLLSSGAQTTAESSELYLSVNGSDVFINGSTQVIQPDVTASNGIIHVVNQVLMLPTQDIVEIVQANAGASTNAEFTALEAALTAASGDLTTVLSGTGPFTVLAPTDAAFTAFLDELDIELADANPDLLQEILEYHVISERVFSPDLSNGNVSTVNGAEVTVNVDGGVTFSSLNTSTVTTANVLATNGVIHIIDKVLIPISSFTIAELVTLGDDFPLLEAAVLASGLDGVLGNASANVTVFAPTDDAFNATGLTLADLGGLTQQQAAEIIAYHAVPGQVLSTALSTGPVATIATGPVTNDSLDLFVSTDGGVFINPSNPGQNIQVTVADLQASNGVIHVVNQVILPPSQQFQEAGTIEDAVVALSAAAEGAEFTQLAAALTRANLLGVLDDATTNFTVFAPTDSAFQVLYDTLGVNGVDDIAVSTLADVLQYHIVDANSRVYSTDLSDALSVTMSGSTGSVTINVNGGVSITDESDDTVDATVITPNVVTSNGVIHIVNQVLLPALD